MLHGSVEGRFPAKFHQLSKAFSVGIYRFTAGRVAI